ncbi:hypothetical protein ACWOA4_01295 [Pediococcus pentosaceus]
MTYSSNNFTPKQKEFIRAYEKENMHYRGGGFIKLSKRNINMKTKSKLLKELNRIEREITK